MKKNLESLSKEIDYFFKSEPTYNQKAWGIINQFYHLILTHMENNNISKADLARKLNKSRAAITQMFNKTPNISILKIVEIADAVGLELNIIPKGEEIKKVIYIDRAVETKTVYVPIFKENWNELPTDCDPIEDKVQLSNSQYGIISSDTSSYNNRIDIH